MTDSRDLFALLHEAAAAREAAQDADQYHRRRGAFLMGAIRERFGFTRAELADRLGCSEDAIRAIEWGKMPIGRKLLRHIRDWLLRMNDLPPGEWRHVHRK